MFQPGEQVLYGIHGVCRITDIERKKVGSKKADYYVLQPIDQPGSTYYIPVESKAAVAKMRPILTQDALHDLLRSANIRDIHWIEDESRRKQLYIGLITGGDRAALIGMVHAIHGRKAQLTAAGKKLHSCDENFLRDAERLLGSEFSLVLNIHYNDVGEYVKNILTEQQA